MEISRRSLLISCVLGRALCGQSSVAGLGYRVVPDWPELPPGWNFGEVAGVAADARGRVYVFHRGPHPILEFESGGKFVRAWGDGLITRAHTLRVDREENLWVIDVGAHVVLKMNPRGRVILQLGRQGVAGAGRNNFNQPTDVAFEPNGDFYVSDGYGNSRVVKFSREGKYLFEWGKKGSGEGEFNLPHAVVLDAQGRVYVSDRATGQRPARHRQQPLHRRQRRRGAAPAAAPRVRMSTLQPIQPRVRYGRSVYCDIIGAKELRKLLRSRPVSTPSTREGAGR